MDDSNLYAQALGLKETAETMIKAGGGKDAIEASIRTSVDALVQAAKQLKHDNPVVAALNVNPGITWAEVLHIANAIYKS